MAAYDNKLLDGEHLVYYTQKVKTELAGKQATISDLSDIRSGAAAGATAVQPGTLATVATSGDYDDLSNLPTIPDELADLTGDATHRVVTDTQISTWNGKQDEITSSNKLDYSLLDNTPTIPDELADLTADATHRVVTDIQIGEWNAKQVALVFNTAYDASTNKAATMTDINDAISSLTGFHFEIVQALPVTGEGNIIYLVLKSTSETGNIYTEYAWINNAWEQLGDTQLSIETLSNSEIDSIWSAAVVS